MLDMIELLSVANSATHATLHDHCTGSVEGNSVFDKVERLNNGLG